MWQGLVLVIPAGAALWALGRVKPKRGKAALSFIRMVLAFTLGCGAAYCFLGKWADSILSWGLGLVPGDGAATLQVAVPAALLVGTVIAAFADIVVDHKSDTVAVASAIAFPVLLVLMVGGVAGATGGGAVSSYYGQAMSVLHTFTG